MSTLTAVFHPDPRPPIAFLRFVAHWAGRASVPLTCWWDGIVSQLRAYTATELERLAVEVGVDGYTWRAGHVPIGSTPGRLTYLIGYPAD